MPDPWNTSASASLAGPAVTLVEGAAFCVSDGAGDMSPHFAQGLFFRDTRFVSLWRLRVNGSTPEPLTATVRDPFSASFVLRDQPRGGRADSTLVIFRNRYVGQGMREDIVIHNYGEEPAFCAVELLVGGDFADVFEVKEGRVEKVGDLEVAVGDHSLTFSYSRGMFKRGSHITFSQQPRLTEGHATYELIVPAGGEWSTCIQVTPHVDGQPLVPRYACGEPVEHSAPLERLEEWRRRLPLVSCDAPQFNALLARSTEDLAALRIFDPDYPDRAVVAAGAPWFMTLFGRDSLITSWMAMLVDPDLALGTLETLARYQGRDVNPVTEEEPGRILHEMRFGESAALMLGGDRVYYGTVDATPLFVMLVGELSRWGNQREAVDALLPAADRAIDWMRDFGDKDGDGYIEYQRTSDRGLRNQGWKDSWDSMRFADAGLAEPPIALAEVQGYMYAALVARGHCATEAGDNALAARLHEEARVLRERFNRDFWIETGNSDGYFAIGLDRDKRQIDGVASNMGHCLWTGIVEPEKAPAVARALMSPDMFSGWGVRTLSGANNGYNPISYHCGSVWPHDNAIIAAGLMRYGFAAESHRVMEGLVDASAWFGDLLPELFAGFDREPMRFPVSYPTSCSPQAWAAASPLLFLRTMLRFEPDIRNNTLHLAPAVPDRIGRLRLERIALMGGELTIEMEGESLHALAVPDGLKVVHEPRSPTL
jgi:glycogen debranching enzyme